MRGLSHLAKGTSSPFGDLLHKGVEKGQVALQFLLHAFVEKVAQSAG